MDQVFSDDINNDHIVTFHPVTNGDHSRALMIHEHTLSM